MKRIVFIFTAVLLFVCTHPKYVFANNFQDEVYYENAFVSEYQASTLPDNKIEESKLFEDEDVSLVPSCTDESLNDEFINKSLEENTEIFNIVEADAGILAEGKCNDFIAWKITSDDTLIISGNGRIPAYSDSGVIYRAPWYGYKNNIQKLIIEEGITAITDYNFFGLEGLEEVELPYSLTDIGLQTSSFPCCFKGCTNLKKIHIYETTTNIAYWAFDSDTSFTIVGKTNSIADIYAKSKGIEFKSDGEFIPSGCFGDDGEWIIENGE